MDFWFYIILGGIILTIVGFIVYKIIQIAKLPQDEKRELIITYLKGLVALAEKSLGEKRGQEKLQMVENYFKEKAPFVYKILLGFLKEDALSDLIEKALKEIKESFSK